MSQPNPHSSADDAGELPTLPRRPRVPAEPPPIATDTGSPAIEPALPRPLDAAHRALPVSEPALLPLPPARPTGAPAPVADPAAQPVPPAPSAPLPAPAAECVVLRRLSEPPARPRHNPRVLAALAYAVPMLPALVLLVRERRNRFIRVHAAQALVFYFLLAGWQIALFFAAVGLGGATADLQLDVVFGLALLALFLLLAVLSGLLWLLLIADAMAGHRTLFPVVSLWAERIERFAARHLPAASEPARVPENAPVP